MKNYYEILEVTADASEEVIKAAYKALVKRMHPDNGGTGNWNGKTIEDVNEAYEILSDKDKRTRYDLEQNNLKSNTETNKQKEPCEEKTNEYKRENTPQQEIEPENDNLDIFETLRENAWGVIGAIILSIIFRKAGLAEWLYIATICSGVYCAGGICSVLAISMLNLFLPQKRKWEDEDNTNLQTLIALFVWKFYVFPLFEINRIVNFICIICLVCFIIMVTEKLIKTIFRIDKK